MEGPFKKPLGQEESFNSSALTKIEGMDEVVRKIDWLDKTLKEIPSPVEKVTIIKKLFEELKKYGIDSPVKWVLANAPEGNKYHEPTLYAFTDKIDGFGLNKIPSETLDKVLREVKELVKGWIDYLSDKLSNGGYFLWDVMRDSQYIYGRRKGDKKDKIYMIDTDPLISAGKDELFICLINMISSIKILEDEFKTKFLEVREKLMPLLKIFENDAKFSKKIEEIKKILNI